MPPAGRQVFKETIMRRQAGLSMKPEQEAIAKQRGGKILESLTLFDVYEGAQILAGHKSVAYSISFRANDHTLEEKEVTAVMNKILNGLKSMGIELRA